MYRDTIAVQEADSGESTVRSDVSVASSGYVLVSAPQKTRKSIPPYYPEEPPPDYDQSPNHTTETKDSHKACVPLIQKSLTTSPSCSSRTSGEMVVSISGASPTQNIKIQISPESTNESDVFLYTDRLEDNNKKRPIRRTCTCTKREKCLIGVVLLIMVALTVVIVNFTVCFGSFTSACD